MFAIFLTIALDFLGLGIILPILTPLFLDPSQGILSNSNIAEKTFLLGILISLYPLAGFFGAPLIGGLSDKLGRKRILIFTLICTVISYLMLGFGVVIANIYLLFLSRILGGFAGGNVAICVSAMTDISPKEKVTYNFGLIGFLSFALGTVLGPLIGGVLSNPHIISWFNLSTPFWIVALLAGINLVTVICFFQETNVSSQVSTAIKLTDPLKNLVIIFKERRLATIFLINFLVTFAFNIFALQFQIILVQKFKFQVDQLGFMLAYLGIWMALTQGLIIRFMPKKLTPLTIIKLCLPCLCLSFLLTLLPSKVNMFYSILPIISIFQGLVWPYISTLVSELADTKTQGEVFGINQSVLYLAQGLPAIILGLIAGFSLNIPILLAGACVLLAWVLSLICFTHKAMLKFGK